MSIEELIASLLSLGLASSSVYLLVKTYPNGTIKGWKPFLGTLGCIVAGGILGIISLGFPTGLIAGLGAGTLGPFIWLRAKGYLKAGTDEQIK